MFAPWRAVATATAALVLSLLAAPAGASELPAGPVDRLPPVVEGSHRAGALEGPEGTFAGLDAALAAGSQVLDLDVRLLADGALAVSHDPRATRLSTSTAYVGRLTAPQWLGLTYDVAGWFGALLGVRPMTFAQVLGRYAGRAALMVEVKQASAVERAIQDVRAAGAEGSVILQSNNLAVVRQVHDAGLHAGGWRSAAQLAADDPATWAESGAEQMVVQSTTPLELLDRAVASGVPVWVCGVNRPAHAAALQERGVRGILSDAPAYTFGRTTKRRVLPATQLVPPITVRRGQVGYVAGKVQLPALGFGVPTARVAVTVRGVTVRTRADATGAFRVAVRAPRTVGTYRVSVSSSDLTVPQGSAVLGTWPVRGTSRWDGSRPVLRVVR